MTARRSVLLDLDHDTAAHAARAIGSYIHRLGLERVPSGLVRLHDALLEDTKRQSVTEHDSAEDEPVGLTDDAAMLGSLLTFDEIAHRWGSNTRTVQRRAKHDGLPVRRVGRKPLVSLADLDAWERDQEQR